MSSGATNSPRTVAVTLFVDEPASDAEIAYWTEELSFTAVEGGSDPANQFIEVWNAGPGAMAWEVEVDEDWLSVSPSGGTSSGEHDKVTVSVDIDDLDTDEYQATITITSDDADNSPQTVLVVLEVTGGSSGSGDPEVSCSPSTLTFDAVEDDDDPESQTLKVWNSGEGRLDWEVSADADWLSVSPRSGTSNGEKDSVTVSVDSSGLSAGSYTGRITVQDEDDSGNRQTVRVTLSIDEPEDEEVQPAQAATYILAVTATPDGAGSISRNISAGSSGYAEGTTVTLSAAANEGYAFIGWSGDAGGSSPSTTIVMNNHRSVVARFLRFDASGLTNVKLAYIPPELTALTVMPYPVDSIPSNPPGFIINWALLVRPQGGGTFALEFSDLPNADYVGIFQVVNGTWTQVPRTVMDQATLQVSLPVTETVLAFATPGTASGQFWKKVTGFFGSIDSTTMTVIAVAAVLVVVVIVLIVFVVRRDSY